MLYLGAIESSMSHNEAWHFSRLGRMIERGDKTGRILDVHYFTINSKNVSEESVAKSLMAKSLLKSASAFEMYRRDYTEFSLSKVSLFLLISSCFPRSVSYCTHQTLLSIKAICEYSKHPGAYKIQELACGLLEFIKENSCREILNNRLHQLIDEFQIRLNEIDNKIFETFFSNKNKPEHFRSYQNQALEYQAS